MLLCLTACGKGNSDERIKTNRKKQEKDISDKSDTNTEKIIENDSEYRMDDSDDKPKEIIDQRIFSNVKKGDIVKFGHYEQDGNYENGKEDIEWIVAEVVEEKDGNIIELISRYAIDTTSFYVQSAQDVNWIDSNIRAWLNKDFYENSFTEEEKEYISFEYVDKYSLWECVDKVCLFDCSPQYEIEDLKRIKATKYAKERGVDTDDEGYCYVMTSIVDVYGFYDELPGSIQAVKISGLDSWYSSDDIGDSLYLYVDPSTHGLGIVPKIKIYSCIDMEINREFKLNPLLTANVGDIVEFGNYEQDNSVINGSEKIEWLVVERNNEVLTLLSCKALDYKRINETVQASGYTNGIEWSFAFSDLYNWLNGDFYYGAFSEEEKKKMVMFDIEGVYDNSYYYEPYTTCYVYIQDYRSAWKEDTVNMLKTLGINMHCEPSEYAKQLFNRKNPKDRVSEYCWTSHRARKESWMNVGRDVSYYLSDSRGWNFSKRESADQEEFVRPMIRVNTTASNYNELTDE